MALFGSDSLVGRALPGWYFFLSLLALIEIGVSGYLVVWTFIFGSIIGAGTLVRTRFVNNGFVQFIYLAITFIFWIAVSAALQVSIKGNPFPHHKTARACEWLGWIEVIFTLLAVPWVLLGVAHAKEGIRGSVAA
ncbi:MAG: hypothetical protein CYPHOPRED_004468 [Cyphobasidiales sp. Tagirdzhanova-0007]|nr:MAG: hypothetical protein CYPHOPRED_004468 [Cyphobasidiales sp. Tagirdzhanova-0007]